MQGNALADAKKAQEVIDSGNSGAFTGLSISVKDNICTLGVKTTCASHMLDDFIPPYNATVMEKLKKDNIVMLGKTIWTNLQWAVHLKHHISAVLKPLRLNSCYGRFFRRCRSKRSADLCAAALGSDTGGSVRQPASFCGVLQVLNRHTALFQDGDLSHLHLHLTKSVLSQSLPKTQAICLRGIYGYDENDATSSKKSEGNYNSLIGSDVSKLKSVYRKNFSVTV